MQESEVGGWLWFVIDVIFVVLLAAGLIYGTMSWRRYRGRVSERRRDEATRQNFEPVANTPQRPEAAPRPASPPRPGAPPQAGAQDRIIVPGGAEAPPRPRT